MSHNAMQLLDKSYEMMCVTASMEKSKVRKLFIFEQCVQRSWDRLKEQSTAASLSMLVVSPVVEHKNIETI